MKGNAVVNGNAPNSKRKFLRRYLSSLEKEATDEDKKSKVDSGVSGCDNVNGNVLPHTSTQVKMIESEAQTEQRDESPNNSMAERAKASCKIDDRESIGECKKKNPERSPDSLVPYSQQNIYGPQALPYHTSMPIHPAYHAYQNPQIYSHYPPLPPPYPAATAATTSNPPLSHPYSATTAATTSTYVDSYGRLYYCSRPSSPHLIHAVSSAESMEEPHHIHPVATPVLRAPVRKEPDEKHSRSAQLNKNEIKTSSSNVKASSDTEKKLLSENATLRMSLRVLEKRLFGLEDLISKNEEETDEEDSSEPLSEEDASKEDATKEDATKEGATKTDATKTDASKKDETKTNAATDDASIKVAANEGKTNNLNSVKNTIPANKEKSSKDEISLLSSFSRLSKDFSFGTEYSNISKATNAGTETDDISMVSSFASYNRAIKEMFNMGEDLKNKPSANKVNENRTRANKANDSETAEKKGKENKTCESKANKNKTCEEDKASEDKTIKTEAIENKTSEEKTGKDQTTESKANENKVGETKADENKVGKNKAGEIKVGKNKAGVNETSESRAKENKSTKDKANENETIDTKTVRFKVGKSKTKKKRVKKKRANDNGTIDNMNSWWGPSFTLIPWD